VQRGDIPGHSVRTEEWRFTEWGFGDSGEELYNEKLDPKELNNLAADPAYAEIVREMRLLLRIIHPEPITGGTAVAETRELYCN
jgi:hypothetical protein